MPKKEKTFKELDPKHQDMVTALAMGLTASKHSDAPLHYSATDVCRTFGLKRTSYAAVQANITRRK